MMSRSGALQLARGKKQGCNGGGDRPDCFVFLTYGELSLLSVALVRLRGNGTVSCHSVNFC
jgi:hypothetical protein